MKAEEVGITLQLLPMLLGFFTYKAAVLSKGSATLLSDLTASVKTVSTEQDVETDADNDRQAAQAREQAYTQHVLTK